MFICSDHSLAYDCVCAAPNLCLKSNGGCHSARKCMSVLGKVKCGDCPKGMLNAGATGCKKAPGEPAPIAGVVLVFVQTFGSYHDTLIIEK